MPTPSTLQAAVMSNSVATWFLSLPINAFKMAFFLAFNDRLAKKELLPLLLSEREGETLEGVGWQKCRELKWIRKTKSNNHWQTKESKDDTHKLFANAGMLCYNLYIALYSKLVLCVHQAILLPLLPPISFRTTDRSNKDLAGAPPVLSCPLAKLFGSNSSTMTSLVLSHIISLLLKWIARYYSHYFSVPQKYKFYVRLSEQ